MTAPGLVIDADRVKRVGYRRFARVLEREYEQFKDGATPPEGKQIDGTTARCICGTIVHGTKDLEGKSDDADTARKLQDYRTIAQRVIQLAESNAVQSSSAAATKDEQPIITQAKGKASAKPVASTSPANDDKVPASDDDGTAGQRIKFLLQDQKVLVYDVLRQPFSLITLS